MGVKGWISVVLAISILIAVLFIIPSERNFSFAELLRMFGGLGENPPPSLTGGFDFDKGFSEASKATLYLLSFPLRWAYYGIQQLIYVLRFVGGAI